MKNKAAAFLAGLLFSLGLGISGMTQPEKVLAFLDVFGAWDPSLMFVMVGAIAVHAVAYRLIVKRPTPLFAKKWDLPTQKAVTPALIGGAFLFGVGWGLAGYCPGPVVTSLASPAAGTLVFFGAMVAGMLLYRVVPVKPGKPVSASSKSTAPAKPSACG